MKNHTLLLLIVALAAFSAPAAAQSLDRFVQVDSVVIAHPPLEFEIRHRRQRLLRQSVHNGS